MVKPSGGRRPEEIVRSPRIRCEFSFKGNTDKLIAGFKTAVVKDVKLAPNYCSILSSGGSLYRAFLQHRGGSMSSSRLRKRLDAEFGNGIRINGFEKFDDEPEEDDHVWLYGVFEDGRLSKDKSKAARTSNGNSKRKYYSDSDIDTDSGDDGPPVQKKQCTEQRNNMNAMPTADDDRVTLKPPTHEEMQKLIARLTVLESKLQIIEKSLDKWGSIVAASINKLNSIVKVLVRV